MKLRILLLILVPPVLFLLCALAILWIPLPQPFPPPFSGERNRISAITTGILGAMYVVGLAAYVITSVLRAGRILDPVLVPAGLASKSYLVFGRQYHGMIQSREVRVYFVPPQGISPAQLTVHVFASPGTRMSIGQKRSLLNGTDCTQLNAKELGLGHLQVYARDEESARTLLADPATRAALRRLVDDQEAPGSREVYLQPKSVWMRARPRRITEGQLRQWLDDLLVLAEASERKLDPSAACT